MGKWIYLSLLILLIFIPFVSAITIPVQTKTLNTGCEILTPAFTEIKQNTDFNFYFHLYNETTFINNNSANCTFHLYSAFDNGQHITINGDVPFLSPRDFEVLIAGANFSNLGRYSYLFECGIPVEHIKFGQDYACGIEGEFEVTPTGTVISGVQVSVYIFFLLISLVLTFFSVKLFQKNRMSKDTIAYSELYETKKRNEFAYYMTLMQKKLWIIGVFGVYLSIFLFTSLSQQLTYNLGVTDISNILSYVNIGLAWGLIPFTIFWFVWLIFTFYKTTTETLKFQFGNFRSGK